MKTWPSRPPPAWRVFITTTTKSSMLLLTTYMKRGNDAMFFDFFARRWWQHSDFLRDELRTVALEQGRLNK